MQCQPDLVCGLGGAVARDFGNNSDRAEHEHHTVVLSLQFD